MSSFTSGGGTRTGSKQANDFTVQSSPSDGISSLSVNGTEQTATNMFIATSWDGSVNCYQLQCNHSGAVQNVVPYQQLKHDAPVLCSGISPDQCTVFSGGCDQVIKMWNATHPPNTARAIGQHSGPVRCLKVLDENMVVTGSWDKTIKIWDIRAPNGNPVDQVLLEDKVYAMDADASGPLVVATADRKFHCYDLSGRLQRRIASYASGMDYQIRCVSIFRDKKGFAAGSIEGRVAIEYFDEMDKKLPNPKKFMFKCHRIKRNPQGGGASPCDIYGVNAISFTANNTFATGGSDGNMVVWDKDNRSRVENFNSFERKTTISTLTFNPMSNLLFYACSYDWSMGQNHPLRSSPNQIMIHSVLPQEIKPSPKGKK